MAQVLKGSVSTPAISFAHSDGSGTSNNYLKLDWTAKQSGNKSTITWTLYYGGNLLSGSNGPQRTRISQCLLSIRSVSGGGTISKTYSTSSPLAILPYDTTRAFTWATLNTTTSYTGSFTVTHDNGVGKFTLQLHANIYNHGTAGWGGGNATSSSVTFELPTTTTACTAPTSVTLTDAVILPDGSFSVAWSGAKAGTNNTISGYRIYYTVTSGGTAPTTSSTYVAVNSTATSGNTTITLSNALRGYIVKCAVRTIGSAGSSYWSGLKQASGTVTINQLPAPPTLNQSDQTILSTSSGVSVTATAGVDPDGQTVEVWYKTSSTGTLAKYTTNPSIINPSAGDSATWYFYTKDSLDEYSQPTEITIIKNLKPVLTAGTYTTDTYKIQNSTGASGNYNKGYAYGITPTLTCNKTCTLQITRQYYVGNTTSSISNWNSGDPLEFEVNEAGSVTLNKYILYDQIENLNSQTAAFNWRLKIEVIRDLETSNIIYFPSATTYYMIAPFMKTTNIYNQFSDSNVTGSNSNQVYRQLRVKFPTDTSIDSTTYTVSAGNSITGISHATSVANDYTRIDITLPEDIASATQIVCTISAQTIASADIVRTKTLSSVQETQVPSLSSSPIYPELIKPFSTSGITAISIADPFDGDSYSTYNILNLNSIKVIIAPTQDSSDSYEIVSTVSGAQWTKSNDVFVKNFNNTDFYDFSNPWSLSYDGVKTYFARIQITNVFGQIFYSPWTEARKFDFVENLNSVTMGQFFWATSSTGTFNNLDSGNLGRLWEGMYLRIQPTINYWTKGTITVNLFNNNNVLIETKTIDAPGATNRTAVDTSTSFIVGPLGTFASTTGQSYTISAQLNNTTTATTSSVTHNVGRLTTADYSLVSASVSKPDGSSHYYIDYNIAGSDSGIDSTLSSTYTVGRYLEIGATSSINIGVASPTGRVDTELTAWDVQQVNILTSVAVNTKPNSNVNVSYTLTKLSRSPAVTVYSLAPTIAYRQNQIGINTSVSSADNDAAVIVQAASNHNLIKLKGASNIIYIDLENGRIY